MKINYEKVLKAEYDFELGYVAETENLCEVELNENQYLAITMGCEFSVAYKMHKNGDVDIVNIGIVSVTDEYTNFLEERTLGRITNILKKAHIEYNVIEKEGWGKVVLFKLKDKLVFANTLKKNDKIDLYYWCDEYSCKTCRMKIA